MRKKGRKFEKTSRSIIQLNHNGISNMKELMIWMKHDSLEWSEF